MRGRTYGRQVRVSADTTTKRNGKNQQHVKFRSVSFPKSSYEISKVVANALVRAQQSVRRLEQISTLVVDSANHRVCSE